MGFLSGLGKILGAGGAIAGAPFTGGGSLAALGPILSGVAGIGGVAAGAAQNSSNQRLQQLQLALAEAQNKNQYGLSSAGLENQFNQTRANQQNQGQLERFLLSTALPSTRADQARRGSLQANVQDLKIGRPAGSTIPQFTHTGGLRPSALGPGARQAGAELERKALLGIMGGDAANMPAYDPGPGFVAPPAYTGSSQAYAQQPKAGMLEKILGGVGLAGSLIGGMQTPSLAELLKQAQQQSQQPQEPPSGVMPGLGRAVRNVRF